jgi:hypothetical protein
MAVRLSTSQGDVVARELKQSIAQQVKDRTGVDLPSNHSIDQMVRAAAKHGIRFSLVTYTATA